ncbi:MAG: DUF3137 domain-containing protein [Acutalibacteraceae bacterium]
MKKGYDRQIDLMYSALESHSDGIKESDIWKKRRKEIKTPAEDFYYKSGNPFIGFLQFSIRKNPVKRVNDVNKLLNDIKGTNALISKLSRYFFGIALFSIVIGIIVSFFKLDGIQWIWYGGIAILFIAFTVYTLKMYYRSKEEHYDIFDYKRYIMDKVLLSTYSLANETVYEPNMGMPYNVMMDTMLFDKCYFTHNENFFTGIHNGTYFANTDIGLTYDSEGDTVEGFFCGHILSIKYQNDFNGTVTVTDREYKFKAKKKNKTLSPVMLNNDFFDSTFIFLTDNENLAKQILTPQIMGFLMHLKQNSNGAVLVSFRNGYVHILIDNKQMLFEVDTRNPDINKDTNTFRNSVQYICDIIDKLYM